jgi:hypothetical protein
MNISSIWHGVITGQGIVNARLVTECREDVTHAAGTLVCEPAPGDAGLDVTVTRFGERFFDEGVFTARS